MKKPKVGTAEYYKNKPHGTVQVKDRIYWADKFRQSIRIRIKDLGINYRQLARISGVSEQQIGNYVMGNTDITAGRLGMLLYALGASFQISGPKKKDVTKKP